MSSNWRRVAELWLKGSAEIEELLIEAATEGELAELEQFFRQHPPSIGSQSLTRQQLERLSCQCAFEILDSTRFARAVHVLRGVCGEDAHWQWLRDAALASLDPSVRKRVGQYLETHSFLNEHDMHTLNHLICLETEYSVDCYAVALEGMKSLQNITFNAAVYTQLETTLMSFFPRRRGASLKLLEDVKGISICPESPNVWGELTGLPEWRKRGSTPSTPRAGRRQEGQSSALLFFRGAAEWFDGVGDESVRRILLEGEFLASHLCGGLAVHQALDSPEDRWRAELEYYLSHHLVIPALEKLDSVSVSFAVMGSISVCRDHIKVVQFEGQVFTCDVTALSVGSMQEALGQKLLKQGIWLQTRWESAEEWIGFLARSGVLFDVTSVHERIRSVLESEHVVLFIIEYCIEHALPAVLQSFLEVHDTSTDMDRLLPMLKAARSCDWARWLILSRLSEQCFAATVANAKCIMAAEEISVKSLSDLARAESVYVVLAALAHSPRDLSSTLLLEPPVLTGSPSQREELQMENGRLCLVEPVCHWADLEPGLQERFPVTCQSLRVIASKKKECGDVTFPEFRSWRNRMLRTELGKVGFLDMVIASPAKEFEELLRVSQLTSDVSTDPTQRKSAEHWETQQLRWMEQKVQSVCGQCAPEGISIGVCQHLISGAPAAALEWFLAAKGQTDSETLSSEDLTFLELLTRLVGIWFYKDPAVVSAALVLAATCELQTSPIKVDVAALQRLDSGQNADLDVTAMMEDLTIEMAMEYDSQYYTQRSISASSRILACLESAALNTCTGVPLASQAEEMSPAVSESTDILLKWSLVQAFATLHHQIPSKKLLEKLAQRGDWILFLAAANFYQSSMHEVVCIAESQFGNPHLGHHVSYILQGKHTVQTEPSPLPSSSAEDKVAPFVDVTAVSSPGSEELFDILLEAEQSGTPIQTLLVWARHLKWQLLCVIAACYPHASILECFVAWLEVEISLTSETASHRRVDTRALNLETAPSKEKVLEQFMQLVHQMCKTSRFDGLLKGMSIFPALPSGCIKHFVAGLKHYKLHMFSATSQLLRAFEDALEKEIKKANASRESLSSSISSSISGVVGPYLDLDLMQKTTQAALLAVLSNLSSVFEKEKLLELLTQMEIDEELPWLPKLRQIKQTYALLGQAADGCMNWKGAVSHLPSVDVPHVMEKLRCEGHWTGAREWAKANELDQNEVTRNQAEALVEEWTEFGLGEMNDILRDQINEIFLDFAYPAVNAGLFYLQQAARNEGRDLKFFLLEALLWVDGTRQQVPERAPRLVEQIRRALFLMDSEGDIIRKLPNRISVVMGSRSEKCPAVQMILRPAHEVPSNPATSEVSASSQFSLPPASDPTAMKLYPRVEGALTVSADERESLEILEKIVPRATVDQVQRAIKLLLDCGQVDAAENIQHSERLAAQLEFFLVDTALSIIHKCGYNGWNGEGAEKVVLVSILSFLQQKEYMDPEREPGPQEVLDAVAAACEEYGGYPVCHRAAVTFRSAGLLKMSCGELATYGPSKALELLLMKGESASEVARDFAAAYEFSPRATATKLAQMYLNSLMGTTEISRINENEPVGDDPDFPADNSDWIRNSVICSDTVEIGNALMQLLVERHSVLPSEVEADLLVQSYLCYEKMGCAEGLDVLLDLANHRVHAFALDQNYEAMVKLAVGICRFDGLSAALDATVQNKKLDLVYQDPNSHNPSTVSTLRSAILSAIFKYCPKDREALNLTHRHFNMHVEVGQDLKDTAMDLLDQYTMAGRLSRDQLLIKAMDLLLRAGAQFSCAQCSTAAAECGALMALVAQQLCHRERRWICLSDAECRELLPQLSDIRSALIVARAYNFNSPQDWVLTLWQHMMHIATEHHGKGSQSPSLIKTLDNMLHYSKSIMNEIVFSEEHLEQVMQMYAAFSTDAAAFEVPVSYEILTQCMIQFLHSVSDVRQRLKLCSMMGARAARSLLQECHTILDVDSHLL